MKNRRQAKEITRLISQLKKTGQDFTVHSSNYTTTIEANGQKRQYINSFMNPAVFAAYNRVRADIKKSGITTTDVMAIPFMNEPPDYFDNIGFPECERLPMVTNIDIKNAYPTTFLNAGFISEGLANYLDKMDKKDKLATLGMLASQKTIIEYRGGHPHQCRLAKANPYRPYFIYAVRAVDEIMKEVARIAGSAFLFFWVDGIYLHPDMSFNQVRQIMDVFRESNYIVHHHTLTDFNLTTNPGGLINVSFFKGEEQKEFNFPDRTAEKIKTAEILRHLKNLKNN
jgi:hypothetical protein